MCRYALISFFLNKFPELQFPEDADARRMRGTLNCSQRCRYVICRRYRVLQHACKLLAKLRASEELNTEDELTLRRAYFMLSLWYIGAGVIYLLYFIILRVGAVKLLAPSLSTSDGVVDPASIAHNAGGGSNGLTDGGGWVGFLAFYRVFYWVTAPLISVFKITLGLLATFIAQKAPTFSSMSIALRLAYLAMALHVGIIVLNLVYIGVNGGVSYIAYSAVSAKTTSAFQNTTGAAIADAFAEAMQPVYVLMTVMPRLIYVVVDLTLYGSFLYIAPRCYTRLSQQQKETQQQELIVHPGDAEAPLLAQVVATTTKLSEVNAVLTPRTIALATDVETE